MSALHIQSFGPEDPRQLRQFVRFPKRLYVRDPAYIPRLNAELLGSRLLGVQGLLTTTHPSHQHLQVRYFMANRNGRCLGRVSAHVNSLYNDTHDTRAGFFGFFDCVDEPEVAKQLLFAAEEHLRRQDVTEVLGPASFSANDEMGCLIMGFDQPVYMGTSYNFPYYQRLIEACGYEKIRDLIAMDLPIFIEQEQDRRQVLDRLAERIRTRTELRNRPVDLSRFHQELKEIRRIYNEAWRENWGFVPLTEDEIEDIANGLKPVVDPDFFQIVERDGKTVAFIGAIPDINQMIRPGPVSRYLDGLRAVKLVVNRRLRRYTRVRLMLYGVLDSERHSGIDALLFFDLLTSAQQHSEYVKNCEIGWLLEENEPVIRLSRRMHAKEHKRWRVFRKAL